MVVPCALQDMVLDSRARLAGIYLTFIYDGWVGNWARVGYMYVNHGSYNVSYACQTSIVYNQFMIHSVVIVTCTNSSIHKSISSVHIHSDAQLMQKLFYPVITP